MKKPLNWMDAATALLLLVWFFLPVTAPPVSDASHAMLSGPGLQALLSANPDTAGIGAFLMLGWLIPVFALYRVAALFAPEGWKDVVNPLGWSASALRLVSSSVLLVGTLIPFTLWGDAAQWYTALPVTLWLVFAIGLVTNAFGFLGLVEALNHTNPVFGQYREFRREARAKAEGVEVSPLEGLRRIRSKLLLAFIGITAVILLILSSNLLQSYQKTILKAVGDGAHTQVAQATAIYKSNFGAATADDAKKAEIAMYDFLNAQTKVNAKAAFPFTSFAFYTDLQDKILLDKLGAGAPPPLKVEYSSLFDNTHFPTASPMDSATVAEYLNPANASGFYDAANHTYSFAATILQNDFEKLSDGTKVKHDRLLGLAVISFDENVILAPYVQTRTIVFILTFLFLYVAIGLVYIVGNFIVNPLLFLRMNVRNASQQLESMIRGHTRVSAAGLQFSDTVRTRDEIRTLSGEIGNMVTVIRGIIPYISASTLKQAEKGIALSERKNLTFLFTDIRGFTTMSEGMSPEEVVQVLNRYLDLETEIILHNHGDVDKFVGDEMMAFFEGPDKELNACRAAMQIRKAMYEEKVLREKQGLPSVEIGIGINTGDVVFGSMGARDRMDFTSIGDTVNLAARLEGANKAYASKSMIAESVYLKVKDKFVCRELDFIAVKGKNEPVRIYEILQEKAHAAPKLSQISKLFEEGLEAYRAKAWRTAADAFEKLVIEYKDGPAEVFLGRVHHFENNPPPQNWDGVFRMEVK